MLSNRSMPSALVIPVLSYPNVPEAIDWLCKAFGFTLRLRIGDHRAQLNAFGGAVVVTATGTSMAPDTAHSVMVRIQNVDTHHASARAMGATILHEPTTFPYGERQYSVVDPAGHHWTFSQSVNDVAPEEWGGEPGQL